MHPKPTEHEHPGNSEYVRIGVILAIITAIEVAIFYIPALTPVMLPLLLILSAAKFALVAMYYMHLKFDSRLYTWLFCGGMMIAGALLLAFLGLFGKIVG